MFLTESSPLEEAACSMWPTTGERMETVEAWLVDRRWGREGRTGGARGLGPWKCSACHCSGGYMALCVCRDP